MSSLAAAQADGYYYPREWRPEHGSLNRFHGSHPLGKRAKDDGSLVVRFEMPFDAACTSCAASIGRGVRFNARKTAAGAYLTTPVYEFQLKCPACKQEMLVRTDPAARGYEMVRGVRKKVDVADALAAGGPTDMERSTEQLNAPEVAQQIRDDPFFRLEHEADDRRAARERARGMDALVERQDEQFRDDYASNAKLRADFRKEKARIKSREREADRLALGIPLLDVHPDDVVAAKSVVFQSIPGKKKRAAATQRKVSSSTSSSLVLSTRGGSSRRARPAAGSSRSARHDSFQHFGDLAGSKLHQMKVQAREKKRKQAALVRKTAAKQFSSMRSRR